MSEHRTIFAQDPTAQSAVAPTQRSVRDASASGEVVVKSAVRGK